MARMDQGQSKLRAIGYVSQFGGDEVPIGVQRRRVARLLNSFPGEDADIVADIGWPDEKACPPGLLRIVKAARVRTVDVVVVDAVARFARDQTTAARIASILCDAGVQVREAAREGACVEPAVGREQRSPSTARSRHDRGSRFNPSLV